MADMPGLIEGAHEGAGLGIQFLRHIQRTRVLLYLVAADPDDIGRPWKDFRATRHEIECYDRSLRDRKFLVTINKSDLVEESRLEKLLRPFHTKGIVPLTISAKQKIGLKELLNALAEKL
jgi:GTPase